MRVALKLFRNRSRLWGLLPLWLLLSCVCLASDPYLEFSPSNIDDAAPPLTSIAWGPDGHLYASDVSATIYRYRIDPATGGHVGVEALASLGNSLQMTGIAFDPSATAENLVLWASHTDLGTGDNFSGTVSRLTLPAAGSGGTTLQQDYISGLPNALRAGHQPHGIAFGPDGLLYHSIGGITAAGGSDSFGGVEQLLSAAIVVADVNHPDFLEGGGPVDVNTGSGYDPFAANAKVRLFATGIRNAYDLAWSSRGGLYSATNGNDTGSARTPDDPDIAGSDEVVATRPDEQLMLVRENLYYGHPNPTRGEYISHAGNPTAGPDGDWEIGNYPVGVQPEPAWDASLNFNLLDTVSTASLSPNGMAEYMARTGLRGRLLLAYFAGGNKQIQTVRLDASGQVDLSEPLVDGNGSTISLPGPLDVAVDRLSGRIYVAAFGTQANPDGSLWLLDPLAPLLTAGDMDCDGDLDVDDAAPFLLGLIDAEQYEDQYGSPPAWKGDIDGDLDLDLDDVDPFVALLAGGSGSGQVHRVAEPSTALLAVLATILAGPVLRRGSR